ncbi:hypothetical protein DFAR_2040003 [Desulfarculales bacterium]
MKPNYRAVFALTREPLGSDLAPKEIMQTAEVINVAKRSGYAIRLSALALATRDVGSGKSTALPGAVSRRHPSEYQITWVPAAQGSILELHRQICVELEEDTASVSRAVLIIDKASLLRLQVLAELHTITQFQGDSKPILPIILAGKNNFADLFNITELPCS